MFENQDALALQLQALLPVYDSRAETGYIGIVNMGATCYLNSIIQMWFHLPYFRKVGN